LNFASHGSLEDYKSHRFYAIAFDDFRIRFVPRHDAWTRFGLMLVFWIYSGTGLMAFVVVALEDFKRLF
jgi:hypothetical protein